MGQWGRCVISRQVPPNTTSQCWSVSTHTSRTTSKRHDRFSNRLLPYRLSNHILTYTRLYCLCLPGETGARRRSYRPIAAGGGSCVPSPSHNPAQSPQPLPHHCDGAASVVVRSLPLALASPLAFLPAGFVISPLKKSRTESEFSVILRACAVGRIVPSAPPELPPPPVDTVPFSSRSSVCKEGFCRRVVSSVACTACARSVDAPALLPIRSLAVF